MEPELPKDEQEADRLRTEVLAVLSHELRTPLAAIKGYVTAMLLEEVAWPEEKRREFLQLISEEVDNLQTMVGEILDTSRIEAGLLEVEPQPIRLPRLAREVTDEMQQRTTKHHFVLDFPRDFPLIDADPRRIKQVLRNILDNALKYSPDGGLIVVRSALRANDVVVSARSAALNALGAALGQGLVREVRKLAGPVVEQQELLLNLTVITEDDVAQRKGVALLFSAAFNPPLAIWTRDGARHND